MALSTTLPVPLSTTDVEQKRTRRRDKTQKHRLPTANLLPKPSAHWQQAKRAAQLFDRDDDVDSEEYQRARKASQAQTLTTTAGANASEVLQTMLGEDNAGEDKANN